MSQTTSGYGRLAILLHWVMAVAIFVMYGLGLYMVELNYYHPWYHLLPTIHKTLGMALAVLWIVRVIYRSTHPFPKPHGTVWEARLAHLGHMLLYLVIAGMVITGYLISTADGHDLQLAWNIHLPGFAPFIENQEEVMGEIHAYLAHTLMVLVALHVVAALRHHFMLKDDTLRRMFKPINPQPNGEEKHHA